MRATTLLPARLSIGFLIVVAGCAAPPRPAVPRPATKPSDRAGVAVYVGDDLLTDYKPDSGLVTKVTDVRRPSVPAIDIHCHWFMQQDPKAILAAMDELGIQKAVNLSGGFGRDLDRLLARFHAAAPDRLLIFCNLDFSTIDNATFAADVARSLEDARAKGASGLKVFKSLGLTARDASKQLIAVDDPRLDPAWDACARLHLPVLIHSGDPAAFFRPIDRQNERWMQLRRHPDWDFFGNGYPTYDEVMAQHVRMIERHPQTVFVSAHLANSGEDLRQLSAWLDRCPNLYVDISGRVPELGRQPFAGRKFLLKYQDRVLFGTDRYPGRSDQPRERIYYRYLETDDEYFDYYDHPFPTEGDWRIYGAYLPADVLKKIYRDNAERVLAGRMPLGPTTRPAAERLLAPSPGTSRRGSG